MSAAEIGAMSAGHKDVAGPTMLFAQVGPEGFGESDGGGGDGSVSKEETESQQSVPTGQVPSI